MKSSLHAIASVANKEFLHILRDRRIVALILILPPFFTLLFGHAFEVRNGSVCRRFYRMRTRANPA